MNPIDISDRLKHSLNSYLTTAFNVNRDRHEPDLAVEIIKSFEK